MTVAASDEQVYARSEESLIVRDLVPQGPHGRQIRLRPQQVDQNLPGAFEAEGEPDEGERHIGVQQFPDADGGGTADPGRGIPKEQGFHRLDVTSSTEGVKFERGAPHRWVRARRPPGCDLVQDGVVDPARLGHGEDHVGQVDDGATLDPFGDSACWTKWASVTVVAAAGSASAESATRVRSRPASGDETG